jgi:hypothetical protein
MNVFVVAFFGCLGAGVFAGLSASRLGHQTTSTSFLFATTGAFVGLTVFGIVSRLATRVANRGERSGRPAVISVLGILSVASVALSPFLAWYGASWILRLWASAGG